MLQNVGAMADQNVTQSRVFANALQATVVLVVGKVL